MASVFLSYDRDDADRARSVALALEKAGHSVWWDRHIKGGAQYSKEIEHALKAAEAVVVLWSEYSVDSAWVRDEAAAGRDSGRLVPVTLDSTEPPLGFRQYQTIDLARWKGRGNPAQLQTMLEAVDGLSVTPHRSAPEAAVKHASKPRITKRTLVLVVLIFIVASAAYFALPRLLGRNSIPVVAVAAAGPTPSAGRLARDLLVMLGSLETANSESMRLIEHGASPRAKADLIFEIDGWDQAGKVEAGLALLSGKDRSVLWSKDFQDSGGNPADLKQQFAFTAARVLECALEGMAAEGKRLSQQTLKLYLNGCAAFAEMAGADSRGLVSIFRTVIENAPEFEGGWAKLLLVESEIITSPDFPERVAMRDELGRHIAAARNLDPNMAEAFLAEADTSPARAFEKRMRLVERAVELNPNNSHAHALHSLYLMGVGRSNDSVEQARRAVQLDPLSPSTHDTLITALTYAGRTEAAVEELRKADKLWPGASNLLSARYRLHLRYGDPQEALRILRSENLIATGERFHEPFIRARIDPSPENVDRALKRVRNFYSRYPEGIASLSQELGTFGREEELFPILLNWKHPDKVDYITDVLFRPALRNVHRDPRMMAVAARLGLLDYWRKSGKWPDFCFEVDLPYDCKDEAAKIAA